MKLVGIAIALAQIFAAGDNFTMFQELLYHKKNSVIRLQKAFERATSHPSPHISLRSAPILANILKSLYQNFSDDILEGLVFLWILGLDLLRHGQCLAFQNTAFERVLFQHCEEPTLDL